MCGIFIEKIDYIGCLMKRNKIIKPKPRKRFLSKVRFVKMNFVIEEGVCFSKLLCVITSNAFKKLFPVILEKRLGNVFSLRIRYK